MPNEELTELINNFIKEVVGKEHQLIATGTSIAENQRMSHIAKIFDKYCEEIGAK